MSLPPETMFDLMALADGELEGEARERAEKLVAGSEEARRIVEAMRSPALGLLLGDVMNERAAPADAIADAVMAKLTASVEPGEGGVVRLADARARRASRAPLVAGLLTVVALAAGIALYVRSSQEPIAVQSPVASVGLPVELSPSASAALAQGARPAQDVELDQVESPHGITVFSVPVGGAAAAAIPGNPSSVVIMIEDDPGPP